MLTDSTYIGQRKGNIRNMIQRSSLSQTTQINMRAEVQKKSAVPFFFKKIENFCILWKPLDFVDTIAVGGLCSIPYYCQRYSSMSQVQIQK